MKLSLPRKFKNIVEQNSAINGALLTLIDKFSDWIGTNQTEFFPEYTDHGTEHIQNVLNTMEEIVTKESFELLTPEDIYVISSAALLHDCAMHINKAGLWDLISNDVYNGVVLGFTREDDWLSRWKKFCVDVKKFDETDFIKFFGKDIPVELPSINTESFSDHQKILIGDFVRQYHACIAQIIATHGIPSKSGPYEIFDSSFKYLNELSGLVARSHNHSLRQVVDLLDSRKREYRNTHPTFLMGILRIADYLQFKSDRTPKILFDTIAFCSPVSVNEWKKHLSIISTNTMHPDDELLFVEAYPEDAKTLGGVKHLLKGLQSELDEFWAVNGEVYSRYQLINRFGVIFRRVRSNIDDARDYVEKNYKSYHPEILSIIADDQKLFPLLIKPLYGNYPRVGLRELLQNAIDACNERYCLDEGHQANDKSVPYKVSITLNYENNTLVIKDEGTGMDVEVIKDYFLKIGSSYRTSESWKSDFCSDDGVLVPRTGKFGIGMLAGFLIGDKIEIQTKKHDCNNAKSINFSYSLDSNEIELIFKDNYDVGTTIIVHTNKEKLDDICSGLHLNNRRFRHWISKDSEPFSSWWYYLDTPEVVVNQLDGIRSEVFHNDKIISKNSLSSDWNEVVDTSLDGLYWRLNGGFPHLYCNGIIIQGEKTPYILLSYGLDKIEIRSLEICVFDNNGTFPLSLTRDHLVSDDFFEFEKLKSSVLKKLIGVLRNSLKDYIFNKNYIISVIESFPLNFNEKLFPIVFSEKKAIPFGSCELTNMREFVLIDFVTVTQNRGVIFEEKFEELLNGMSYACFYNVDKQTGIIEKSISSFIMDNVSKNIDEELESYLFIKSFDLNKLRQSYIDDMKRYHVDIISYNDEWSIVTHHNYKDRVPLDAYNIMDANKSKNKYFMFVLYNAVKGCENEFSRLYEMRV
ncbi:ATP-binding protein [Vibrio sp. SNU_ST1]|uniref:HD domain-containing protein n=1 Tax=Vibrio sp. SNU_ST1 TaxID=3064001 RepID=UPI00272D9F4D|nr:ATP-binding protein [Vibrio sp. SNU_ST1]WKY58884.1 ATP-binding protein [Vibrio sp. SNU_ST1]